MRDNRRKFVIPLPYNATVMGIIYMMMSTLASVLVIGVLSLSYFGLDIVQNRIKMSTDLIKFFLFLKRAIVLLIVVVLLFLGIRMAQFLFL